MAYGPFAKSKVIVLSTGASTSGHVASYQSGGSATTWPVNGIHAGGTASSRGSGPNLFRQIAVQVSGVSAAASASIGATVCAQTPFGEGTVFSTAFGGTATTFTFGPFIGTVSNIRASGQTATGSLSFGWGTAVATQWHPVDWHAGGVVRAATHHASANHNSHWHHTYSNILGDGSVIIFGMAAGTASGTEDATSFEFPFSGLRLQTEGSGTLNYWIYQSQIKSN